MQFYRDIINNSFECHFPMKRKRAGEEGEGRIKIDGVKVEN